MDIKLARKTPTVPNLSANCGSRAVTRTRGNVDYRQTKVSYKMCSMPIHSLRRAPFPNNSPFLWVNNPSLFTLLRFGWGDVRESSQRLGVRPPLRPKNCLISKMRSSQFPVKRRLGDSSEVNKGNENAFATLERLVRFHVHYKHFHLAAQLLKKIIIASGYSTNDVTPKAYRKYLLIGLINDGKLLISSQEDLSLMSMALHDPKNSYKPYIELGRCYEKGNISEVEAYVQANLETFIIEKNMGLVKQVVSSLHKTIIKKLSPFDLSLQDMAEAVQLHDPEAAHILINQMTRDGEIDAKILKEDGAIGFPEASIERSIVDWQETHPEIFNPVFNQVGPICWAINAVAICEILYAMEYKVSIKLSVQELLDNAPRMSCFTKRTPLSRAALALVYIVDHGVSLESNYPFDPHRHCTEPNSTRCCNQTLAAEVLQSDIKKLPRGPRLFAKRMNHFRTLEEEKVLDLLRSHPVCASVVGSVDLHELKRGEIYRGPSSPSRKLGFHSVILVGYGSRDGIDYYRVRNPWGPKWCDDGYGMIERSLCKHFTYPDDPYF